MHGWTLELNMMVEFKKETMSKAQLNESVIKRTALSSFIRNFVRIPTALFGSIFLILIIGLINLTSANQQDAPQTLSQIFNSIIRLSFFYIICKEYLCHMKF